MRIVAILRLLAIAAIAVIPTNGFVTDQTTKWGALTSHQRVLSHRVSSLSPRHLPIGLPLRLGEQRKVRLAASVAGSETQQEQDTVKSSKTIGSIRFLIPSTDADTIKSKFGSASPTGNPSLLEAVQHIARKLTWWTDDSVETTIILVPTEDDNAIFQDLCQTDIVLALGLQSERDIKYANSLFTARRAREATEKNRQCQFAVDCAAELPATVGPYDTVEPSLQSSILPWTQDASGQRMYQQMTDLFSRCTSDDVCYALCIFLNQFSGYSVDWVKHSIDATWEKGPVRNVKEVVSMVTSCGDCIKDCVNDPKCREAIGRLTQVDTRDQVASYRTIVSYESKLLTDFSFCILQKNNVFNCDAEIPQLPKVIPVATWRGMPLTEEAGRSILVGHLKDDAAPSSSRGLDVSWQVAYGANVAYDQFPSQNQLFYPAARGRDMWYDPVFRVETLDGRTVWCKRHYKVRPGPVPGTFRLSVLDNGITSNEFWTIAGVADDLSWVVFHYAGAASAVGQRYLGGLLCTPDGALPLDESQQETIWNIFSNAGIESWDLYKVDNYPESPHAIEAGPPPLDFFRKGVLERGAVVRVE